MVLMTVAVWGRIREGSLFVCFLRLKKNSISHFVYIFSSPLCSNSSFFKGVIAMCRGLELFERVRCSASEELLSVGVPPTGRVNLKLGNKTDIPSENITFLLKCNNSITVCQSMLSRLDRTFRLELIISCVGSINVLRSEIPGEWLKSCPS